MHIIQCEVHIYTAGNIHNFIHVIIVKWNGWLIMHCQGLITHPIHLHLIKSVLSCNCYVYHRNGMNTAVKWLLVLWLECSQIAQCAALVTNGIIIYYMYSVPHTRVSKISPWPRGHIYSATSCYASLPQNWIATDSCSCLIFRSSSVAYTQKAE